MEKSSAFKLRLGLFVILGFVLFVAAIFFIGRQNNLFNATFSLYSDFNDVSGLQVGNNVRFSGINVGTVESINILNDTSVRVHMRLQRDVQRFIKKDSRASIGSEGLIGDRIIIISQGALDEESVADGFRLASENPVSTEKILANLQTTGENAAVITDQLAEIMYKINNGNGTLSRLLADSGIAQSLSKTMENLETGSKEFNETLEAAQHSILLRGYFNRKEKERQEKERALKKERNKKEKERQNVNLKTNESHEKSE